MQRCKLASAAVFVLAFSGATAGATDLPPPPILTKAPPVTPSYGWTGCYVGGHFGGGWGKTDFASLPTALGPQPGTATQTRTTTQTLTTILPGVPFAKARRHRDHDHDADRDHDRDKDRDKDDRHWDKDHRHDRHADRDHDRDKDRDKAYRLRDKDHDHDRRAEKDHDRDRNARYRNKDRDDDRDADNDRDRDDDRGRDSYKDHDRNDDRHHRQPDDPPRTVTTTTTTTTSVATTTTQTIAAGLAGSAFTDEAAGVLGGGQVGCNYQLHPNWVIGVEGDVSASGISGDASDPSLIGRAFGTLHSDATWLASVTGRVGYAFDRLLLFVRGGAAWAHQTYDYGGFAGGPFNFTGSDTRGGWTAGAGVEWALLAHWSAKVEYDYYGFATRTVTLAGPASAMPVSIAQSIQTVTVGLNYHF